jgi:hypothetical protein
MLTFVKGHAMLIKISLGAIAAISIALAAIV